MSTTYLSQLPREWIRTSAGFLATPGYCHLRRAVESTNIGLAAALGAKYFWIELACSATSARSGRIAIITVLGTRQARICHTSACRRRFSPLAPGLVFGKAAIKCNPIIHLFFAWLKWVQQPRCTDNELLLL
jgi:hypothetical protein